MTMTSAARNGAAQADVIAEAHAVSGVDSSSISYVETHGTATPLGDPIAIDGLRRAARRPDRDRRATKGVQRFRRDQTGPVRRGFGQVKYRSLGGGLRNRGPDQDDSLSEKPGDPRNAAFHQSQPC